MPDEPIAQPIETGTPEPVAEPQDAAISARAELYKKYYEGMPQQQAEPVVETPVAAAPEPQPAAPVAQPPELVELITSLRSEVGELKERLNAPSQPPPVVEHPAPTDPGDQSDWLTYLQQGKFDEGKRALQEEIERTVGARVRQQAVSETLETFRIQQDATAFINDLREKNPDVLPLEDLISVRVAQHLEKAKSEGKLSNGQDFLNVYKTAVKTEVEEARKLVHQLRADGKTEALVTKREVLSATPLTPQAVNSERMNPKPQTPTPETVDDYIAKRIKLGWERKGIAY
jgi:hypothetical protein